MKFGQPAFQEEIDLTITNDIIIFRLGRVNLIFCCADPTNHNFWQIKIIILISHINIFLFTIYFSFRLYVKNKNLVHLTSWNHTVRR